MVLFLILGVTRDRYPNCVRNGMISAWWCHTCQQLTDDFREHIPSSASDDSFLTDLNAEISSMTNEVSSVTAMCNYVIVLKIKISDKNKVFDFKKWVQCVDEFVTGDIICGRVCR